jgi:PAS domain S-box-containing protein
MTASATPQTEPFGAPGAWEILNAQAEVIDAIARGAEFYETLRCIALIVERLIPPAICSILLVDDSGRHLRHGAGPSLPDAYKAAIDGIEIGPTAVACGGAAFRRETVIVADVADAPLLENYRPLALQLGLRACWSHPIIDEGGTVLGVFALYHPEPGAPAASDLDLIDRMARLVRVALTQQRREKALRETEQRLRDYVSVASDWLWEQDSSHRLTFVSRNIEGSDLHSLLGKTGWEVVFEGADAAAVEAHKADLDARRPFRNFRVRRVGRHGRVHALNISGMPIYDDTGRFCGYRGVAQDVSKQATAEEASRRSKLQAIEANRAKTEFLANVSHELRTPLNAILGFSEMMKGAMLGPISPRYREYAADIHASGQYLDSLVTSLLDLSRIEMGRVELFEEAADIAEIIDDSFRLLAMRAREQGVDLSVEPLPDLRPAAAEAGTRQSDLQRGQIHPARRRGRHRRADGGSWDGDLRSGHGHRNAVGGYSGRDGALPPDRSPAQPALRRRRARACAQQIADRTAWRPA